MNIAILTNNSASFSKPLAEGLNKLLASIPGISSKIFYDGLSMLNTTANVPHSPREILKDIKFLRFYLQLIKFNVVIVVETLPGIFLKNRYQGLETLRKLLPEVTMVNYASIFLPTRGKWAKILREGGNIWVKEGNNYGLERFDWYLVASNVSEYPLPEGNWPDHQIGINLDDSTLYPEAKKEFTALIDFERTEFMHERAIQIEALEQTSTPYIVLNGHYSIDQIRQLYRNTCIYFIAHRESFGLPICELQACGAYIFTPYADWCPSHWLKPDLHLSGPGILSPNFIVYENKLENLKALIQKIRKDYDPNLVYKNFETYHPQLLNGDIDSLSDFVDKVKSGVIHSRLHGQYVNLNDKIIQSSEKYQDSFRY